MYTSTPCPEFLTSNLLITHENFVDYEDDEDESSKSQGRVLTKEEDLGPDLRKSGEPRPCNEKILDANALRWMLYVPNWRFLQHFSLQDPLGL